MDVENLKFCGGVGISFGFDFSCKFYVMDTKTHMYDMILGRNFWMYMPYPYKEENGQLFIDDRPVTMKTPIGPMTSKIRLVDDVHLKPRSTNLCNCVAKWKRDRPPTYPITGIVDASRGDLLDYNLVLPSLVQTFWPGDSIVDTVVSIINVNDFPVVLKAGMAVAVFEEFPYDGVRTAVRFDELPQSRHRASLDDAGQSVRLLRDRLLFTIQKYYYLKLNTISNIRQYIFSYAAKRHQECYLLRDMDYVPFVLTHCVFYL
jgi:hypothetical protein